MKVMKRMIRATLIIGAFFMLSSFTNLADIVGTYGVAENDPSGIELTLNEDYTFTFHDFSNPEKPIDVKGDWEIKNNHILLKNYVSEYAFHNKWKIDNNCKAAKSRKGMTFYRLIKK